MADTSKFHKSVASLLLAASIGLGAAGYAAADQASTGGAASNGGDSGDSGLGVDPGGDATADRRPRGSWRRWWQRRQHRWQHRDRRQQRRRRHQCQPWTEGGEGGTAIGGDVEDEVESEASVDDGRGDDSATSGNTVDGGDATGGAGGSVNQRRRARLRPAPVGTPT